MKKFKKKAQAQNMKPGDSKELENMYKFVGRMICADDRAREAAQDFIKDESFKEQEKKWKQLLMLVSCEWTEYAEQVKRSMGDYKVMNDLLDVLSIRNSLGIDMPGYIPFCYE